MSQTDKQECPKRTNYIIDKEVIDKEVIDIATRGCLSQSDPDLRSGVQTETQIDLDFEKPVPENAPANEPENTPFVGGSFVGAVSEQCRSNNGATTEPQKSQGGEPEQPTQAVQQVQNYWNAHATGFPIITGIRNGRLHLLQARIRQYGLEAIQQAIDRAARSDFLHGDNARGWQMTFDWFIRPNNFPKVLEGNYDNKQPSTQPQNNLQNDGQTTHQSSRAVYYPRQQVGNPWEPVAGLLNSGQDLQQPTDPDNPLCSPTY